MPTPTKGKRTVVFVKEFDLTTYFKNAELARSINKLDTTMFGPSDWEDSQPGMANASLTLEGLWTGDADDAREVLEDAMGGFGSVITVGYEGHAFGKPAKIMLANHTTFDVGAPYGELVSVSGGADSTHPVGGGVFLHSLVEEAGTDSGDSVDNTDPTVGGWVASLHATAVADDLAVIIEASEDDSVWVTLGEFAELSAPGSEYLTGEDDVPQFVRASWTNADDATFVVAFARAIQ